MKNVMTIIVLTSSGCNLDCDYCCVLGSRKNESKFSNKDIKQLVHNCSVNFDSVEFCWHGGEPLLVGVDFYKEVLIAQKEESAKRAVFFRNKMQSNGYLLNKTWLDFIQENDFHLGLSFDAPLDCHKLHRKEDPEKLLVIFHEIKRRNMPLGLLCVVTGDNVLRGKEIFNFFKSIGVDSFSLLPLKKLKSSDYLRMPTNEELTFLYKEIFDLWLQEENKFNCIEPITTMMKAVLGEKPKSCIFSLSCLEKMITIDQNGNVVPCGSLVSDEFILGNVLEKTLSEIISSEKTVKLKELRRLHLDKKCASCRYFPICLGGCRVDAFWYSGKYDGDYPFCETRKAVFQYMENRLAEMLS